LGLFESLFEALSKEYKTNCAFFVLTSKVLQNLNLGRSKFCHLAWYF